MELNIDGYTKSVMNYMLFDAIKKLKRARSYDGSFKYEYPARGLTVDLRIKDVKALLEFGHWEPSVFINLAEEDFE